MKTSKAVELLHLHGLDIQRIYGRPKLARSSRKRIMRLGREVKKLARRNSTMINIIDSSEVTV